MSGSGGRRGRWAVLTPVFEDRGSFADLCRDIATASDGLEMRVCAVDDGSVTAPPDLSALTSAGLTGEITAGDRRKNPSRNRGQ